MPEGLVVFRGSLPADSAGRSYNYPILQVVTIDSVLSIRFVHDRASRVYWYDETQDEIISSPYGFSGAANLAHHIGVQCGVNLPGSIVADYQISSKSDVTWRLDPLP